MIMGTRTVGRKGPEPDTHKRHFTITLFTIPCHFFDFAPQHEQWPIPMTSPIAPKLIGRADNFPAPMLFPYIPLGRRTPQADPSNKAGCSPVLSEV